MQYILDTVVQALAANPSRKFVGAEMVSELSGRFGLQRSSLLLLPAVHLAQGAAHPIAHSAPPSPPCTPPAAQSFFERWWRQQDDETRGLVTQLVQEGRVRGWEGWERLLGLHAAGVAW